MLKQPERESRNVNDLFYEMEGRQIQKMNKVLADVELTKAEEKTLIWLAGWEESTVDHLLSVIEKTARIRADKKGGYAHKSKCDSEKSSDCIKHTTSPRRLRAKDTHRTNFVYALRISPFQGASCRQADKFVNRCLCTYSQQCRREPRKEDAYRQTFIYQTK